MKDNIVHRSPQCCSGCGHAQWWHKKLGKENGGIELCDQCFNAVGHNVEKACQEFIVGKPVSRKFVVTIYTSPTVTKLEYIDILPAAQGAGWEMFRDGKAMFEMGTRFTAMQMALNVVDGIRKGLEKNGHGHVTETNPPALRAHSLIPQGPTLPILARRAPVVDADKTQPIVPINLPAPKPKIPKGDKSPFSSPLEVPAEPMPTAVVKVEEPVGPMGL